MDQNALLVVGILIGGIAGAGLMGMLGSLKAGRLRRENERREEIISSVEEAWVDVDNIVSSYRSGRLNAGAFREAIEGKIESINRLYKPGIHQLDIFFVKYTEKRIEEYRRLANPAETPRVASPADAVPLSDACLTGAAVDLPVSRPATPLETPEPVSEISFPSQDDDRSISEAAEAAATDSNLQLESFLEMDSGSFDIGSVASVEESETPAYAEGVGLPADAGLTSREIVFEPESGAQFEDRGSLPPQPAEGFGESEPRIDMPDAKTSLDEESFLPPPPADIATAGPDFLESETIIQPLPSRFSFAGRVTSEQNLEPVSPPSHDMPQDVPPPPVQPPPRSQPFSLPPRVPAGHKPHAAPLAPPHTSDDVAQPATIFDVEAETIIVDRSTIMDAMRAAQAQEEPKESEKKSIGITGEDVSDTFDKFFGLGK